MLGHCVCERLTLRGCIDSVDHSFLQGSLVSAMSGKLPSLCLCTHTLPCLFLYVMPPHTTYGTSSVYRMQKGSAQLSMRNAVHSLTKLKCLCGRGVRGREGDRRTNKDRTSPAICVCESHHTTRTHKQNVRESGQRAG